MAKDFRNYKQLLTRAVDFKERLAKKARARGNEEKAAEYERKFQEYNDKAQKELERLGIDKPLRRVHDDYSSLVKTGRLSKETEELVKKHAPPPPKPPRAPLPPLKSPLGPGEKGFGPWTEATEEGKARVSETISMLGEAVGETKPATPATSPPGIPPKKPPRMRTGAPSPGEEPSDDILPSAATKEDKNLLDRLLNKLESYGTTKETHEEKYLGTQKKLEETKQRLESSGPELLRLRQKEHLAKQALEEAKEKKDPKAILRAMEAHERAQKATKKHRTLMETELPVQYKKAQKEHKEAEIEQQARQTRGGRFAGWAEEHADILKGAGFGGVANFGQDLLRYEKAKRGDKRAQLEMGLRIIGVTRAGLETAMTPGERGVNVIGSLFGTVGNVAGMFGPYGKAIQGITKLGEVSLTASGKLLELSEGILKGQFRFAEVSGSMARVEAEQEMRDITYMRDRGEARAYMTGVLARSYSSLRETVAPIEDFGYTLGSGTLATVLSSLDFVFSGGPFTQRGRDIADRWVREILEGNAPQTGAAFEAEGLRDWSQWYGAPERWRPFFHNTD